MLRAKASFSTHPSASYRAKNIQNINDDNMDKPPVSQLTTSILTAATFACMPAFQMGWAIGILNSLTEVGATALGISTTALSGWPLLVSVFCPAGFAGSQLAGPYSAAYGRAQALWGMAWLGAASSTSCVLAIIVGPGPWFGGFWLFFLGRALIGFASGASTVVVPQYLAEIAPPSHSGFLGGFFQLAVVVGIFAAQVTALVLSSPQQLVVLLALPALFAVVTLVLHSTCFVESPTWLQNGPRRDADAAQQARKRLGLLSYLDHDSTSGSSTIPAGSRFDGSGPDDEVGKDGASSAVELLLRSKDEEEGGDDGNDISGDDSDNAGLQSGHNLHSDHRRRNTNSTSADAASSAGSTSSSAHNRSGSSTGSESESLSLSEVWADARLRLPSMVLTALLVGQQLSGINAVFYYSTDFFAAAGLENSSVGTLLASGVNLVATACVIPLIESRGRRPLLLIGCVGMAMAALALTFAMSRVHNPAESMPMSPVQPLPLAPLEEYDRPANEISSIGTGRNDSRSEGEGGTGFMGWCAVVAVLMYVTAFEVGLGAIPWQIGNELMPSSARDATIGFASGCNWFANFMVGLCFPALRASLGPYAFLPFFSVCASLAIGCWLLVPETKGRSPDEVVDIMHAMAKRHAACFRRV